MATLKVNGQDREVDVSDDMPLLWALREKLGLLGTKFGCGQSQCGACTVLIDGEPTWSCMTAVGDVVGVEITTIEGLSVNGQLGPVQQAWAERQVPQCGYCQSGQIMVAHALLTQNPSPNAAAISSAMNRNICRCGTYNDIKDAVKRAAALMNGGE